MLKWAVGQKNPTPGQLSSYYTSTSTEGSTGTSCLSRAGDRLHIARKRNSRGAIRKASIRSLRRTRHDKENQPCSTPENVPSRTRDNSLRLDHFALRDVSNSPDPYTITPQRHNIKRRQSHPLNVITKHKTYQHSKSAPTNSLDFLNCYKSEPQTKPVPQINLPQALPTLASHKTPRKRKSPLDNSCNNGPSDIVDMRKPSSTLKSLSTMQIEYSPGPLTATQSLMALRQRLTSSLSNGVENTPQGVDNPLYYALNPKDRPQNHGITINCNGEQSPMLEGLLEEKSIVDQVSKDNSKIENTLVSSLSQRLEWLRLNNSLKNDFNISLMKNASTADVLSGNFQFEINNQGMNNKRDIFNNERRDSSDERAFKKRRDCDILKRQKCILRRRLRRSDRIGAAAAAAAATAAGVSEGRTLSCDKVKPKIQEKPKLMGLTLPLGIPSPITSEDSGLCSLGLEGIHPLSSSPIEYDEISTLTEAAMSKYQTQTDESTTSSLVVNKCSPSSICSSLRKRYIDDDSESNNSKDTWNEEMIPMIKTPKLMTDDRLSNKDSSSLVTLMTGVYSSFLNDDAAPSPLALVEKRSRSRRCLRFVSPGSSTCQRRLSASRRPLSLSCPRLRDGRQGYGELELSVYCHDGLITIHVGRGSDLHRPSGTACNAYVKVALVPSCERTFFRTPVQRESSFPNFNEKFSFQLQPEDLNKRILVSVWHRDRDNRKSEFLGCVSLAVKNAVKKEISGSFRLVAQSGGSKTSNQQRSIQSSPGPSTSGPQSMMARRSESSSIEEVITIDEEPQPSPEKHCKFSGNKKRINDDSSFLRHLELEPLDGEGGRGPLPEATAKGGRTPFTTTKQLTKQPGSGFGFSIAWIQPPRVERVEAGQAADRAGIRPGDYVIFVDKFNVVTMSEEQVLQIIKSCGNELTLEIYRKTNPNGVVEPPGASLPCNPSTAATTTTAAIAAAVSTAAAPSASYNPARSSTICSATTSTSLDLSKRRLHLPQVAFTNEATTLNPDDTRKKSIYQLLSKEQNYAINLQFGINRFLVPLTERKDFLNATEHHTLFQNIEELLRLTEDILEHAIQEEDSIGSFIGRLYLKRIPSLTTAYRRYCSGIKRADCLLAEKSKNTEFTRFCAEPPIPRRRPDLCTFLHKPLEHYRETLKLLQTILNLTKSSDGDHLALSRVVHEMQATFREVTAGLMEPEVEGRPLLSLQDLESRLVFTRCKPFVLSAPGRQWIFGGDLCRIEGRAVRPFWALLFTDMMVFAKVSRDRVLFITEEPLSLMAVSQAFFNIRKKANEFRLLLNSGGSGMDSPANAKCGPDLVLSRTPRKNAKCRSIALRAPTPELKAVWQNLIQRQIIYLNTTRGGTPASSPMESPDPPTTLSVGTLDSLSLRRQAPLTDTKIGVMPQRSYHHQQPKEMEIHPSSANKQLNELIDHKCRQLGKTKTSKGSAMHLAEWMKGQLGNMRKTEEYEEDHVHHEPEPEIWSQEELKRRTTALNVIGMLSNRAESRCEEIDLVSERSASRNTERSHQSFSTSESQTTVKSNHPEKTVSVCRQCHKTCLSSEEKRDLSLDDDDFDDNWGPLTVMGMCGILPSATKASVDPFTPVDPPLISVLPPTPENQQRNTNWDYGAKYANNNSYISCCIEKITSSQVLTESTTLTSSPVPSIRKPQIKITDIIDGEDDEETPEGSQLSDEPPYRTLSSSLRRFGTLNSLERVGSDDDKSEEEEESEKEDDEDKIEVRTYLPDAAHSLRGWTQGARSFVAEKMAIFERLSGADTTTTVRKTSFLERYLKPSGDNHLDSPPDPGTNTSSSGRGEDEGETSGATSGEEVWGTPTSGGEFEEELVGESSALSFMESPHGSIVGTDDDTEQLMEDLLISLPMLAARAPGVHPRRRLEPLPEEDDTESSSAPCSPKPLHELKPDQGRGSTLSQQQHHDNCPKFGSSVDRPLSSRKDTSNRPRIGTIDRALGIHSDEEVEEQLEDVAASPSLLHRLGLRRNRDEGRKSNKLLGFLSGRKVEATCNRNSAAYGGKPLFKYLFNKDTVDDIPTSLPRTFTPQRPNDKQLERRFWKQLRRRRSSSTLVQSQSSPQVAV